MGECSVSKEPGLVIIRKKKKKEKNTKQNLPEIMISLSEEPGEKRKSVRIGETVSTALAQDQADIAWL